MKIDRDQASKDLHRQIGSAWKHLPVEQKEVFQRKAAEAQAARSALQARALGGTTGGEEAAGSELTKSQAQRLNNARLDGTLESFANHPCWQKGLALGDHICALKASLLLPLDADKGTWRELRSRHSAAFGYDGCRKNPKPMPSFMRACYTQHAGVCQQQPHFATLQCLVAGFDAGIKTKKLGAEPFLARMAPRGSEDALSTTWLVVAGVCLRPLCHSVIHMHQMGDALQWSVLNGNLRVSTMHRVLQAMLAGHVAAGEDATEISVQVPCSVDQKISY